MSEMEPRKVTTLIPARSKAPLVVGGLIAGTLGLVVIAAAAVALFQVALTAVTVVAWVVVVAAFWYLWPALVYSLQVGRLRLEDAVTRANPLEALELERQNFAQLIQSKTAQLAAAGGELKNVERVFAESQGDLSVERREAWSAQIENRKTAYATAQQRLDDLRVKLTAFDREIKVARAEMQMADADASLAKALDKSGVTPDLSRKTRTAVESITKEIGQSSALLEEALRAV